VGNVFIDATVQEKVAFGGDFIMVWGAFSLPHRSPLYLISGNLTAVHYRDEILPASLFLFYVRWQCTKMTMHDPTTRDAYLQQVWGQHDGLASMQS